MCWYEQLDEKVREYLPDMTMEREVPLSKHTSFRIGGPARRLAFPANREQLVILMGLAESCGVKPFLLGRGTNLLVDDRGLDTLVIKTAEHMTAVRQLDEVTLEADAGILLNHLAVYAQQHGLSGLEFAHGIPGTLGGAICMNAGAYGGEMRQVVTEVTALLPEGVILDPDLLATLPLYHKKACALDALCQGIESYWARKATEDSQVDAFLAFTGVLDNLRPYLAGDPHAAEELQYAAYRSGCAIAVSRTTAAHAMSYRLTKRYGLAHGHACMLTLPAIWEAMLDDTDALPVLMDLAQKMRLGSELMGPRLLRGILYDLEMPFPPVPDAEALDDLTRSVNVQRLSNNPRIFTAEEIRAIYRRSMTPLHDPEKQACLDIWRYYGA